jgi:hypothetical protein
VVEDVIFYEFQVGIFLRKCEAPVRNWKPVIVTKSSAKAQDLAASFGVNNMRTELSLVNLWAGRKEFRQYIF